MKKIGFRFQVSGFSKIIRYCSHFLKAESWKLKAGSRGFTLVEMIVAIALFAIVMLVCVGTLLALVNANRKAQALQSVMNNLNITIDGMVRAVRMGTDYHGAGGDSGCTDVNYKTAHDCTNGGKILAFEPYGNAPSDDPWIYSFANDANGVGRIYKSEIGQAPIPITAPEVSIDDIRFYVIGTTRGDTIQPKIVIVIKGSAGAAGSSARTTFHIQATAVQRVLDL